MKTTLLKISFIFLFLSLIGAGCEKDEELLWEISPDSETAVIQKEVDGIEFKFCLLNEEGDPATVFNEGENFTFQFSSENKRKDTLTFDRGVIGLSEFCEVRNQVGESLGSPFIKPVLQELIGRGAYPFQPKQVYIFEVPWIDNREAWNKWHGTFKSAKQVAMPNGKYSTKFTYLFNFGNLKTDSLTFKINFEIRQKS